MRDDFAGVADDAPVYVISVAAALAGMHPQTLRTYDRLGLVSPGRSAGRGRRYSGRDIAMLREVQRLSHEEGVNLAGIKRILELEDALAVLRSRISELQADLEQATTELRRRPPAAGVRRGDLIPTRTLPAVPWHAPTFGD